jgi:ankyrin repeat protein
MARPKKKLLPKDFAAMLEQGDLAQLKAVFETRLIDARGDDDKRSALAFDLCPDALAHWLVAQGADLHASTSCGDTPLHLRACSWRGRIGVLLALGADPNRPNHAGATPLHEAARCHRVDSTRVLLAHGAQVDALDAHGLTPLALALTTCQNADLTAMIEIARDLLAAGARTGAPMHEHLDRIGKRFDQYRAVFKPEHVDAASAALDALCALFQQERAPV